MVSTCGIFAVLSNQSDIKQKVISEIRDGSLPIVDIKMYPAITESGDTVTISKIDTTSFLIAANKLKLKP